MSTGPARIVLAQEKADIASDQIAAILIGVFLFILGVCLIVFIWIRQFGFAVTSVQGYVTAAGALLLLLMIGFAVYYWRRSQRIPQINAAIDALGNM